MMLRLLPFTLLTLSLWGLTCCNDEPVRFVFVDGSDESSDPGDDTDSDPDDDSDHQPSTDADADTDSDVDTDGDSDMDTDSDSDTVNLPHIGGEAGIGSPCTCTGPNCEVVGSPVPSKGVEVGCDDVPAADFPNAKLSCMRSFAGNQTTPTPYYYANGFCTLYAAKCRPIKDPIGLLCDNARVFNWEKFNRCPHGSALISSVIRLEGVVLGYTTIGDALFKYCAPLCEDDSDCRLGEADPVFGGEPAQYQCIDKDGVKFCLDPRALHTPPHDPDDYTAVAF